MFNTTQQKKFGAFRGWRIQVHPARSIATPAASGESLVFGGGFGSHEVYAVDPRTGQLLWEHHTQDDGPTAATLIGDLALINTESCTLEAIDLKTGNTLWQKWLGDPLLAQPAAAQDRVLMVWPASGRHFLGAFAVRTGDRLWQTEIPADAISAPIISAGRAWVTTFDGSVTCVDLDCGRNLWSKQVRATSAPWIVGNDLYVAQRDRKPTRERQPGPGRDRATRGARDAMPPEDPMESIAALGAERGKETGAFAFKGAAYLSKQHGMARKAAFADQDAAVGFGEVPASAKMHLADELIGETRISRAWRYQGSRPVVVDGTLFDAAGDRLEATDATTGEVVWSWGEASTEEGERRLTPPAVANGRVLIGTWDGRLLSFEAATGAIRWEVRVGAPVHWQPTMSNGRVFAGLEDGSVVCVETLDPLDDAWPMWGGGPGHNGHVGAVDVAAAAGGRRHDAALR